MIKYIFILFVLLSCRGKDYWKERTHGMYDYDYTEQRDYYQPKYDAYTDSFYCVILCKNNDYKRFKDSCDRYYKLMFPNGNPSAYQEPSKCNCK